MTELISLGQVTVRPNNDSLWAGGEFPKWVGLNLYWEFIYGTDSAAGVRGYYIDLPGINHYPGLLYTDSGVPPQITDYLNTFCKYGIPRMDVCWSEQGLQRIDYCHFDAWFVEGNELWR